MEFVNTCSLFQKFWGNRADCWPTTAFFFGHIHFSLEVITLLCLHIAKLEQLDNKRLFVGASADSHYSMLGLGKVKKVGVRKTIIVSFVQKLLWYLIVKQKKFAQTRNLLFDRHQLLLVKNFCKNEFIGGVAMKTMKIVNFNQPDISIFFG